MSHHFACIGVLAEAELLALSNNGSRSRLPDGASMTIHEDPSGARAITYAVNRKVICSKPGFSSRLKRRARVMELPSDSECDYCCLVTVEVLGRQNDILYRQLFELENVGDLPALFEAKKSGDPVDLTMAGFAEKIEVYDDFAAYRAAHPKASGTVGPGWVLHVGSMEKFRGKQRPPSSHLIVYGIVRDVEALLHHTTEHRFLRARVQAYESDLDVLIDPSDVPDGLAPGRMAIVTCYVTG